MNKTDIYAGANDSPKFGRLIQTEDDPQPPNWATYANGVDYRLAYDRWAIERKRRKSKAEPPDAVQEK